MIPPLVDMQIAQQVGVQARVEERGRTGNDATAQETEFDPQVRYDLAWGGGRKHLGVLYAPRLVYNYIFDRTLPDPVLVNPATLNAADPNDTPTSFLHAGGIGLDAVWPRWRLSAYEFASYGEVTTSALFVQAPWAGDELPADPFPIIPSLTAPRFTLLFAQTRVSTPIRLSPRVALTPTLLYNSFGGADSGSRATIALTSGPAASLALEVVASKNDRLITTVGAGRTATQFQGDRTGATVYRGEATQSWRHWFTSKMSSELVAGGTVGGSALDGYIAYSETQAGLLYDSYGLVKLAPGGLPVGDPPGHGERLQIGIVAKITPWIDLFSGDFEQRGTVVGAVNYIVDRVSLRAAVSGAHVLATDQSVATYNFFGAEGGVKVRLSPILTVDGGLRYGAQDFDNAIRFSQISQGTVFVGVAYQPLPARL